MAAHGANVSTLFVGQALKRFFPETFFADITHREFKAPGSNIEAKITEQGQQFQILDITGGTLQNYTGADLTATEPTEVRSLLTIDQTRAVLELIKDINTFKSQVKNPKFSVIEQLKNNLKQFTEGYILSFWADAASGNWIGTDYVTGSVTVTATVSVLVPAVKVIVAVPAATEVIVNTAVPLAKLRTEAGDTVATLPALVVALIGKPATTGSRVTVTASVSSGAEATVSTEAVTDVGLLK
jgi:hypothetical protein